MDTKFVKWPKLLVWHIERQRFADADPPTTVCGLIVTVEVQRRRTRPPAPARVCRSCDRMKDADTMKGPA